MAHMVIPSLWIGDRQDAAMWQGDPRFMRICVMASQPVGSMDLWMPVSERKAIAALLDARLMMGNIVLLYCENGDERAPAAAAFFLHARRGMSIDEAYETIRGKRPSVIDRREWIV